MCQWFDPTFEHLCTYKKMNIQTIKFLNKLKNASLVNQDFFQINSNKLIASVLKILYKEGFVLSYKIRPKKNFLNLKKEAIVHLRYVHSKPVFKDLKIISTPSHTIFMAHTTICRIVSKKNILIFSTNKGLLTGNECKKFKIGGILLFKC